MWLSAAVAHPPPYWTCGARRDALVQASIVSSDLDKTDMTLTGYCTLIPVNELVSCD